VFDRLQTRLLTWIAPVEPTHMSGAAFQARSKLAVLLGEQMLSEVRGRDVIDFGCGEGAEAVELAQRGANVFGIDIRESVLSVARRRAEEAGVTASCSFGTQLDRQADIIVSIDAFEHFADPAGILRVMHDALRPGGMVLAAFGPTWYHPYGGHLFSVFPWAHLLFSERSLIDWRSRIRSDGATRFSEVEGGLNQMTIRRFEALASASPFRVESIEPVPIRRLARLHNHLTREAFTSVVRARLRKESS
jgi:SAM-dependent methyltransferase